MSLYYRCVHCHNIEREDAKLTLQNPDAREQLIRALALKDPDKRDGSVMSMTPATTLWGAVNRESFYNGYYAKYHRLRVADGRTMNPKRLADAVQVCCKYCSTGRFPEPWELDSILAFLWGLELKVEDLAADDRSVAELIDNIRSADPHSQEQAKSDLKKLFLRAAGAEVPKMPQSTAGAYDVYDDGNTAEGDAERGDLLYHSACAGCHGTEVNPYAGERLVRSRKRYHEFVLRGTERNDEPYMPMFTTQRLSRLQVADIRAFLQSPAGEAVAE